MASGDLYAYMGDEDIIKVIKQLRETQRMIKKLRVDEDHLKTIIKTVMEERHLVNYAVGDFVIYYAIVKSQRFNLEKFKKEEPDIYEQYLELNISKPLKII